MKPGRNSRYRKPPSRWPSAKLAKMSLRAPFAGVVGLRSVSVGDFVKDGQEMVNFEGLSALKVDFRLPEMHLTKLARGQRVELASDAMPGKRFAATVDAIDPLVDANGRSLAVRARLDNPDGTLRPGMFVRVRSGWSPTPACRCASTRRSTSRW
jgi:membrane fusion protein (multidrug efflux system)